MGEAPSHSASRSFALSVFVSLAVAACGGRPADTASPGRPAENASHKYLPVFVTSDGVIVAGGQEVSLSRLEAELATAKADDTVVVFWREPSGQDRAGHGMLVLKTIQAKGVEVRMCGNRECSDTIGPDGKLRPE
jgi:hypothetical protein